jgi:uncharacterized heparinase superfamily protein
VGPALSRLSLRLGGDATRLIRLRGVRSPGRLVIAPQDIRTSDPTVAADFYAGHIVLAGRTLDTHGQKLFEIAPPTEAFAESLHGFGWLRHMRAADTPLAKMHARTLVSDWIALNGRKPSPTAVRLPITARRMMSWISQSPLLLDGADGAFYRRFIKALTADARRLDELVRREGTTTDRLRGLIALTSFALSGSDLEQPLKTWTRLLCLELERQIHPDGGHASRNPAVVLEYLLDLLPLRLAFAGRRMQAPEPIVSAVDRMIPMLRMMRHQDGALAHFNGMGATPVDAVAAVLAYDEMLSQPAMNAPHTGYQRMMLGESVVLMDCGAPPPTGLSTSAHLAPLAFEFSSGGRRIIVNCGVAAAHRSASSEAARHTAAHSSLVIAETSAGRISELPVLGIPQGVVVRGATSVPSMRSEKDGRVEVDARHDGYVAVFGLVHRRRLLLDANGLMLEGLDEIIVDNPRRAGSGQQAMLRFHLHPALRAAPQQDRLAVFLSLPGREVWRFEAGGLPIDIEDSVMFASPDGARATLQLVVRFHSASTPSVLWRLEKVMLPKG